MSRNSVNFVQYRWGPLYSNVLNSKFEAHISKQNYTHISHEIDRIDIRPNRSAVFLLGVVCSN